MIRNAFYRFMYGRYGSDQLNIFLIASYLILLVFYFFSSFELLNVLSTVLMVVVLFRMFSRNIPRRREENLKFMQVADPVLRWLRFRRTIHRDKEHRYFKCPNCNQQLRVPRGKGRITVTCRSCGASFQENS